MKTKSRNEAFIGGQDRPLSCGPGSGSYDYSQKHGTGDTNDYDKAAENRLHKYGV